MSNTFTANVVRITRIAFMNLPHTTLPPDPTTGLYPQIQYLRGDYTIGRYVNGEFRDHGSEAVRDDRAPRDPGGPGVALVVLDDEHTRPWFNEQLMTQIATQEGMDFTGPDVLEMP